MATNSKKCRLFVEPTEGGSKNLGKGDNPTQEQPYQVSFSTSRVCYLI